MLSLLVASLVEITVSGELHIPRLLEQLSRDTDTVFLYTADDYWVNRVHFCPAFSHKVPPDRVLDTYRAILAFFDFSTHRAAGTSVYGIGRTGCTRSFIVHGSTVKRARHRVAVTAFGGRAVLEFAYPLGALIRDAKCRRGALLEKSRRRLLHSLQGVSAVARAQAARLLGLFGRADDETRRLLAAATKDEDERVRRAAGGALARFRR